MDENAQFIYDGRAQELMLPDERTTLSNTLALPSDVEALVAAPGRGVARPLVLFLRSQGISVQTAGDADSAFEEALLHPPDIVLIDDRIPPAGGVELCQRLKGNVRTHFVPTILYALNDLRQFRLRAMAAGADAVFAPSTDAQERRTRLWSLLRTRALFKRMEKKQRTQGSQIVERRRWVSFLLHDLQGSIAALQANVNYMARFGPPAADARRRDFDGSVEDARTVFDQLMQSVRTVTDFDRLETGQMVLDESRFELAAAAAEVVADLRRYAAGTQKTLTLSRPAAGHDRPLTGDRELIKRVMANLVMNALRRGKAGDVALRVSETDRGARFSVACLGEVIDAEHRSEIFEPYAQLGASPVGYGLGLALARAVVEMHDGTIWVEELPQGAGSAFVFELSADRATNARSKRRAERAAEHRPGRSEQIGRGRP
jgi:signal transduction histidine kinase